MAVKILKEIEGSFSANVFLVEKDDQKMVLKQNEEPEWVVSEKSFYDLLRANNMPALDYYDDAELKPGEMLLEYVEGSVNLGSDWTLDNCRRWGEVSRRMHDIKYDRCFRYDAKGNEVGVDWGGFLNDKHERSLKKADEWENYGFSDEQIVLINQLVSELFNYKPDEYCLIHGDLHTGNVLIRGDDLVLFDREWYVYSGDRLYDLAIAWKEMPGGSLVQTHDYEHVNDLEYLVAFIEGYGWDFRRDELLKRYVVLLAFSRLYTPFAKYYKEIILNILE